jgi:hypothetical protein
MESAQDAADWMEREWPNLAAIAGATVSEAAQEDLVRLARIVSEFSSGSRGLTGLHLWASRIHLSEI